MLASTTAGGATPAQDKSQGPSGPEEKPNTGHRLKRGGPGPNSPMTSELGNLMEEGAGGPNHGRRASSNPEVEGRHLPLGADEWQAAEFMRAGGWTVARVKDPSLSGMTGHRGTLHEDEYVDAEALQALVEAELGFTYEQVRSVYRQGPLSAQLRELRGQVDARVLALSRAGANVALLGKALGFPIKPNGNCRAMENALARARKEAS